MHWHFSESIIGDMLKMPIFVFPELEKQESSHQPTPVQPLSTSYTPTVTTPAAVKDDPPKTSNIPPKSSDVPQPKTNVRRSTSSAKVDALKDEFLQRASNSSSSGSTVKRSSSFNACLSKFSNMEAQKPVWSQRKPVVKSTPLGSEGKTAVETQSDFRKPIIKAVPLESETKAYAETPKDSDWRKSKDLSTNCANKMESHTNGATNGAVRTLCSTNGTQSENGKKEDIVFQETPKQTPVTEKVGVHYVSLKPFDMLISAYR